jgi:hypothetical protein
MQLLAHAEVNHEKQIRTYSVSMDRPLQLGLAHTSRRVCLQLEGPLPPKPFRTKPIIMIGQVTSPCTHPGQSVSPGWNWIATETDQLVAGLLHIVSARKKEKTV